MNIILFDDNKSFNALLPLTFTRPLAALRLGITTIAQKWLLYTPNVSYLTYEYLSEKYQVVYDDSNWYVNGSIVPNRDFFLSLEMLKNEHAISKNGHLLAYKSNSKLTLQELHELQLSPITYTDKYLAVHHLYDIFALNGQIIRADFEEIKNKKRSVPIDDPYTRAYNLENIYIEEGVKLRDVLINAEYGPIYIGKNAEIHEGALIRGPFALGEGAVVNMGAKIRGDVTIGPYCKVGGEVSNSIFIGYSNKAHDGFLGNSVIGEWCNIGADTNTSNLKNNYSNIKLWSYESKTFEDTGRMFCGLFMGDHTKCGINTMFNSGSVTGVCCNIFGGGFVPKHIPSFSWGSEQTLYEFDKAMHTIALTMQRRGLQLTDVDKKILHHLFSQTHLQK